MSTIPVNSTITLNNYIRGLSTVNVDTSAYVPVSNATTLKKMKIGDISQSLSVATTNANGMMSSGDKARLNHYPSASAMEDSQNFPRFVAVVPDGTTASLTHAQTDGMAANNVHGGLMTSSMYNTLMNSTREVSTEHNGLVPRIPPMQTTYDHPRFLASTARSSEAAFYHGDIAGLQVSTASGGLAPKLPTSSPTSKYLRGDGTWATPPDTNTTYARATLEKDGIVPHIPSTGMHFLMNESGQSEISWVSAANIIANTSIPGIVPKVPSTAVHFLVNEQGSSASSWQTPSGLGITTADATTTSHGYMTASDALIVRNAANLDHRGTVPSLGTTNSQRRWFQVAPGGTNASFKTGDAVLVNDTQDGIMSVDMLSNLTLLHNDSITFSGKKSTDPDTYYPYIHFMMPPTSGYHLTRLAIVTHTDQIGLYLMNIRYTNSSTNATSTTSGGASYHVPSGFTASLIHVGGFDFTSLAMGTAQNSSNGDFYVNLRAGSSSSPYSGSLYIHLLGGMKFLDVGGTANNVTYIVSKEL